MGAQLFIYILMALDMTNLDLDHVKEVLTEVVSAAET